jgi:hypothetical protein
VWERAHILILIEAKNLLIFRAFASLGMVFSADPDRVTIVFLEAEEKMVRILEGLPLRECLSLCSRKE